MSRRGFRRALLVAVFMVIAVVVTLPRQEFSNGGENLLIATATETQRTGRWLAPTLNEAPRVNKPPLPMWLSAVFISDQTMASLSSPDPAARDAALRRLGWETRWPALLASALAVLVAYELGRTLSDRSDRVGCVAAAVCATQLLFLRNARNATTDIQLTLWVALGNLLIAKALFDGWRWRAAIGAGLAIGLGMMSKGPVALVQSAAPLLSFVACERWCRRDGNWPLKRPVRWWGPIVVGFIAMLLVGLPWYLLILWKQPGVVGWWWKEVTREGATDLPPNSRLMYLVFFPSLAPWTVFFFAGIATAIGDMRARPADESAARRTRGLVFAVILVVVPLLIMTLFRDRKDRYTLPMTVPAAVVAAHGVMAYWRARSQGQNVRWLGAIHWAVVAVMAIGVPIIGAIGIDGVRTISGEPWFTWPLAISAAALAATVAALAVWREQVRCRGLVEMTVILMLALQVLFLTGYRKSNSGRSEMKPLADEIWAAFPDANVRVSGPDKIPVPPDLPLYLNRSVTWTAWPIQLQAGERPWVVVVRQRLKKKKTDPVPQCPPGWTALTPVKRDQNLWHAFALPAK